MGATLPVTTMTTTLLLVLATTATLFFDLAAAGCTATMFIPGHFEVHDKNYELKGTVTEKSGKIEVLNAKTKALSEQVDIVDTRGDGPKTFIHALFGTKPTYKWYTAVEAVDDDHPKKIANDTDGNYYVFDGPSGEEITVEEWKTGTVALDPVGNGKPKEIVWIALIKFVESDGADVLSVYINEETSFRSGPMRYAGYKGNGLLAGIKLRSQREFNLEVKDIDYDAADNARLFFGYGTFENAKVAMNVHFQAAGKALTAGKSIDSAAGFVYHDFEGSNKALREKEPTDVPIKGDAQSLGWIAAYDPTLKEFAFYQHMAHMGDGFHNGVLTMGKSADAMKVGLKGTIVFASRDSKKFTLYLPEFKEKNGQDAIRAFYGKNPWSPAMETALNKIPATPEDDTANKICLSDTSLDAAGKTEITNGKVNTDPGLFEFYLKTGDTCDMVKWVAFRQTKEDKKYLAHRDMTKM